MLANTTIEELRQRFKPDAAKNLTATYLITIKGEGGGAWLIKINDGDCDFVPQELPVDVDDIDANCFISVNSDDLEMIMSGQMSAMTAAMSGILAIEGELGLAMQLVPIFFEGQAPFI